MQLLNVPPKRLVRGNVYFVRCCVSACHLLRSDDELLHHRLAPPTVTVDGRSQGGAYVAMLNPAAQKILEVVDDDTTDFRVDQIMKVTMTVRGALRVDVVLNPLLQLGRAVQGIVESRDQITQEMRDDIGLAFQNSLTDEQMGLEEMLDELACL